MKVLTWLMSRFNVSPELIGDIAEGAAGHSTFWLLRQCPSAILSTVASDLWSRKRLTLRALLAGWAMWIGGMALIAQPDSGLLDGVLRISLWSLIVGWAISRTHLAQPIGAVLLYLTSFVALATPILISAIRSWLHPSQWGTYEIWPLWAQLGPVLVFTFLGAILRPTRSPSVAE